MERFNQSTVCRVLAVAVFSITAVFSGLGSSAFASGGVGYQGSDLKGVVVPVALDGGLPWAKARSSVQVCLTKMARDLWNQAYQDDLKARVSQISQAQMPTVENFKYAIRDCGFGGTLSSTPSSTSDRIEVQGTRCKIEDMTILIYSPKNDSGVSTGAVEQYILPAGLPQLDFDIVRPTSLIDQIDRYFNPDKNTLTNVRVVFPESSSPAIELLDRVTGKPSGFTVNTEMYGYCLQSELQRSR